MPRKLYYCPYCDRQINDTPESRSGHNATPKHVFNVRMWFESRGCKRSVVRRETHLWLQITASRPYSR